MFSIGISLNTFLLKFFLYQNQNKKKDFLLQNKMSSGGKVPKNIRTGFGSIWKEDDGLWINADEYGNNITQLFPENCSEAKIGQFATNALKLAHKHAKLSGRSATSAEDLSRAFRVCFLPFVPNWYIEKLLTPGTHCEQWQRKKQQLREQFQKECAAFEHALEQRKKGDKSVQLPPVPDNDLLTQDKVPEEIKRESAKTLLNAIEKTQDIVPEEEKEEICFCSEEVQNAHPDMYAMWRARDLFEQYVKENKHTFNPIQAAIVKSIERAD